MASVCVVVAALYFAQDVLIPLALAMLLTFLLGMGLFNPLVLQLLFARGSTLGDLMTPWFRVSGLFLFVADLVRALRRPEEPLWHDTLCRTHAVAA